MAEVIPPSAIEFYKVLFEQARDGIFIADGEGRYIDVNESGHRMLGYEPGTLIGKHITDILRVEDHARLATEMPLLKAGESLTREWSLVRKDGTRLDVEIAAQQLSNKQLLGVVRDLSERNMGQLKLRESEAFLQLSQQAGQCGSWNWEVSTGHVRWSDHLCRIHGIEPDQFDGTLEAAIRLIHPEDRHGVGQLIQNILAANDLERIDYRIVKPTGEVRFLWGRGQTLLDENGRPARVIGVVSDVTDRKLSDEALRKSEGLYRTLVETAHDMIWSVDAQGRWIFVNDAVKNIYGYDPAEMLGRPFMDFETAEQAQKDLEAFARIKAGEAHFKYETEHLHKDGHPIWLSFNAIVLRDSQGTVLGTTGTARDITESKRLENQLRQVQKIESIGRLAGGVAHDFNNLLGAILGYSELAQQQIPEESDAYRYLAGTIEAARRGGNLTQQLLAFARKKVVKPEVVDLNKIVAGMEPMLRRLIGEDLDFYFVSGASLSRVKVDIGSLEQVIMNLTVNARDAMLQHGKLTLETTNVSIGDDYAAKNAEVKPGQYVLLAVTDTGTGMTEKVRAQIFEPFFTTKPVGQGTGLGLAMSHGIVKQAGGHIAVYSEVGTGTTFKIYLPIVEENINVSNVPAATPMKGGTETILFVEDEALVRDCAKRALSGLGYNVIVAANGLEALDLLSSLKGPIHLLVTDVVMPKMGGCELAKKIVERIPGIKILYSSGYTENAIVHGGILKESINFIQKPYLPSELADRIRRILDGR